jgi:hypothetical protein
MSVAAFQVVCLALHAYLPDIHQSLNSTVRQTRPLLGSKTVPLGLMPEQLIEKISESDPNMQISTVYNIVSLDQK